MQRVAGVAFKGQSSTMLGEAQEIWLSQRTPSRFGDEVCPVFTQNNEPCGSAEMIHADYRRKGTPHRSYQTI